MPSINPDSVVDQHDYGTTRTAMKISQDAVADGNIFRKVRGVNSKNKVTGASVEHDTLTADHIKVGSLSADLIDVEQLSGISADLGEIVAGVARDEDNTFRINFNDASLNVQDEQSPSELRVQIGRLGAGIDDYGIAVWGADGSLILGADGLGVDVVGSDQLLNSAVTGVKIEDGAVSSQKIFTGAVIADKIAAGAVISEKIFANAVTTEKINALAVNADKIAPLSGNGLFINLHATGSDPVLDHDGFTLRANGDAEFSGELSAASGTFAGDLTADQVHMNRALVSGPLDMFFDRKVWLELDGNPSTSLQPLDGPNGAYVRLFQTTVSGSFVNETYYAQRVIESDGSFGIAAQGDILLESGSGGHLLLEPDGRIDFGVPTDNFAGASDGFIIVRINGVDKKIEIFNT